jgi:hypothetical protein
MVEPQKRHKTGFRGPSPDVGKATQIKPGEVRNPGGRPKSDLSAEVARLVFEGMDTKQAATALRKILLANPKMFQVLSDRAYGKLKIPIETSTSLHDMTDEELRERLERLKREP